MVFTELSHLGKLMLEVLPDVVTPSVFGLFFSQKDLGPHLRIELNGVA